MGRWTFYRRRGTGGYLPTASGFPPIDVEDWEKSYDDPSFDLGPADVPDFYQSIQVQGFPLPDGEMVQSGWGGSTIPTSLDIPGLGTGYVIQWYVRGATLPAGAGAVSQWFGPFDFVLP